MAPARCASSDPKFRPMLKLVEAGISCGARRDASDRTSGKAFFLECFFLSVWS